MNLCVCLNDTAINLSKSYTEMSRSIYDNWDRLIGATLKREQFRELARAHSRDPNVSSIISSDFSSTISTLSSPVHDQSGFHPQDGILQLPIPKPISFKALKNATKNLSQYRIIGQGKFGVTLKGWINEHTVTAAEAESGMPVAIKAWNPGDFEGFSEWLTSVNYLKQLRHPNVIRLIAYCHEGNNMFLVYEFMPRGSLENHLFGSSLDNPYLFPRAYEILSWATRIKVAVGAARGLSFLHDAKNQVIHGDFHTAHILLDEEFNAKLSGFSLAKDRPTDDETRVSTRVVGTYGYAAPEYIARGNLTEKCDVYSFGVVLLELLSGRRAIDRSTSETPKLLKSQSRRRCIDRSTTSETYTLVDWARPYLSMKKVGQVMDAKLEGKYNKGAAVIFANLALQCVSHQPESRPRMDEVLATLEQLRLQTKRKKWRFF